MGLFSGGLGGVVNDILGIHGTNAPTDAANTEASYYQQAQDFLTNANKNPAAAMNVLGEGYGLGGQSGSADFMSKMMSSPIYASVMQQLQDQQNQAGASASQRGLLGSGVMNDALAKYRSRAGNDISQEYLSGLSGIAQQNYNPQIANTMIGKGQVLGQGMIGQAQSDAQTQMGGYNFLMQGAQTAAKAGAFA